MLKAVPAVHPPTPDPFVLCTGPPLLSSLLLEPGLMNGTKHSTNVLNIWYQPGLINLLKPTGHVMHQQFNIQQLYILSSLYLCVLYLSEKKTATYATYSIN